jgi:hypothetical protein
MMQAESTDQGLFSAADRLWSMVNDQLDAAVGNLADQGVDWNQWQLEGVSFFELVIEGKAAQMFPDSREHNKKADGLRASWEAALSARKMTRKAVNRAVELVSMLGTMYLMRESLKMDGAAHYFDLAADAYRSTGALAEVLHTGHSRAVTGKITGGRGGKAKAVENKTIALRAWAVSEYKTRGNSQPAQTFARTLLRRIPGHLNSADVTDLLIPVEN